MATHAVLELLSKQDEEERRFEIVSAVKAEAEADRFYDDGYYVTVHNANSREEAAEIIAGLVA